MISRSNAGKAYVLAARKWHLDFVLALLTWTELTGVSQLAALLAAPVFGYLSDSFRRFNLPLITGALFGVISYLAFGLLKSPEPGGKHGSPAVFVIVIFIGFSQISAIVCSLGLLGTARSSKYSTDFLDFACRLGRFHHSSCSD